MPAADSPERHFRTLLLFVPLGLLAAVAIGGALSQRAPEPAFTPVMADRPVVFPNGVKLHVQRYEVTIAEWNACHAQDSCTLELRARPNQDPASTPATGLSYIDVQEYLGWINSVTRHRFRLPTAGEWEFMAASVLPEKPDPLFTDPSLTWASTYLTEGLTPRALRPQGGYSTSPEGIADLDGSVWEWTQDCYAGASGDDDPSRCPAYFVAGEHVAAMSYLIRDPTRGGCAVGSPPVHLGMRLVSDEAI